MISVLEYVELGDRNIESYKIGMQFLEEGKKAMKALDIDRDGLGLADRENDTHLPEEIAGADQFPLRVPKKKRDKPGYDGGSKRPRFLQYMPQRQA